MPYLIWNLARAQVCTLLKFFKLIPIHHINAFIGFSANYEWWHVFILTHFPQLLQSEFSHLLQYVYKLICRISQYEAKNDHFWWHATPFKLMRYLWMKISYLKDALPKISVARTTARSHNATGKVPHPRYLGEIEPAELQSFILL